MRHLVNKMTRFAIVALLVLSPLNGLWVLCPPAGASAQVGTSEVCERVCPAKPGETVCFASSETMMVSPFVDVSVGPVSRAEGLAELLATGEVIADLPATLQDFFVPPSTPPPKA